MNEKEYSMFRAKIDLSSMDEKLKRLVILRNEMVMLAEELGVEVKNGLLEVIKK